MTKIISFPHIGNYYIPIEYLIKKITKQKVIVPPPITKKTIELGSKYSPDFVCVPFKYNLGNYIESLEQGANIILQGGGGCRYGYYAELQEQILKDLGYEFEFVNFIQDNKISLRNIYQFGKKNNKKLNIINYSYYLLNAFLMILIMDKLETNMREKMGFELKENSFNQIEKELFTELKNNVNPYKLFKIYFKYKKKYKKCKLKEVKKPLKIAVIGELFSIMEPYSSCYIEKELAKKQIKVKRFTTLTYLLFFKKINQKRLLRKGKKYIKYPLGADGTESVVLALELAKKGYDGIVHIKSFGCTPEINAMPILNRISNEYQIPIIYFSFDSNNNEVGINTRLEAFHDMILSKRNLNSKENN